MCNSMFVLTDLGNSPGDYKDIKDLKPGSDEIKVDEGTLTIHNIQKNHEGHYLCEAVNGIGSGLSAVITISVQGMFDSIEMPSVVYLFANNKIVD